MKVGILGTGKIVQEFLPWLVEHAPFTVQALCSTPRSAEKAQELCRQYGVPQHTTNYLELLQWVDVVYLAVPNLQHTRYAKVALEAGKHVIVEKPMACTAAQTRGVPGAGSGDGGPGGNCCSGSAACPRRHSAAEGHSSGTAVPAPSAAARGHRRRRPRRADTSKQDRN